MHKPAIHALSAALALGASVGLALAQDDAGRSTATQQLKPVGAVPPPAARDLAQQTGTPQPQPQPGAAAPKADVQKGVLVNGSLAVPGAPADTETTPAKFSARNAAIDRLPTVGFRLKYLTDNERRQLYQLLTGKDGGLALSPGERQDRYARVGAQLPATVAMNDVTAVPEAVSATHPELTGTGVMTSGADLLIVNLNNSEVVGVLSPQ